MNLYMVYWIDPASKFHGGHVLVRLSDWPLSDAPGKEMSAAIDLGISKARAMCSDAVFSKVEKLSTDEKTHRVLWTNEWYA